jgi:hypothetical protein
MSNLSEVALGYKSLGLSVVPVLATKRPPGYWQKYQQFLMSDRKIIHVFDEPEIYGIAIVCGKISGDFEGLDADCKYDLSGTLMNRFCAAIKAVDPRLLQRLVIASTRNGGYHFYYRCPDVGRNLILAQRPSTPEELTIHPNKPARTLLETRSNGGIIIVPPTNGYQFIRKDLRNIPTIDPTERQLLIQTARSFNHYHPDQPPPPRRPTVTDELSEDDPFFAYDQTDDVIDCLQRHGWILVRRVGPRTYFRRPGDTDKDTSGDFHHELRLFKVFTTNSIFEADKGYSPHRVYAFLECNKDFNLAAKKLLALGHGVAYNDRH